MSTVTDIEIREHDVRGAPESEVAAALVLQNLLRAEARPDDPPTPLDLAIAERRNIPDFIDVWGWLAWSGETVAASAAASIARTGDNEHVLECEVEVHADHRRRGLGRELLGRLVDLAEAEGRRMLLSYTEATVPAGEAFARRVGAEAGLVERVSELPIAEVDRELVRRWSDDGPRRGSGYELLLLETATPDELVDDVCRLYDVTNTAPRDTLDIEDEHLTPERLRAWEASREARGGQVISCYVRHLASGELVGFTDLFWNPAQPEIAGQGWTAVHPDHRGHALGKWLKAVALDRLLERWPDTRKIVTGNAYSNDAMIGINTELGFREVRAVTVWQVPVDTVKAYLAGPSLARPGS